MWGKTPKTFCSLPSDSSWPLEEIMVLQFQVTNIDSEDNLVKSGRLEVTATDIIFHRGDLSPINWPLRYLRRYGWDSELFSFESGRRAPTGKLV